MPFSLDTATLALSNLLRSADSAMWMVQMALLRFLGITYRPSHDEVGFGYFIGAYFL